MKINRILIGIRNKNKNEDADHFTFKLFKYKCSMLIATWFGLLFLLHSELFAYTLQFTLLYDQTFHTLVSSNLSTHTQMADPLIEHATKCQNHPKLDCGIERWVYRISIVYYDGTQRVKWSIFSMDISMIERNSIHIV